MSNNIMTRCRSCIFKTVSGCSLGKAIYRDENREQLIDGYCRIKRTKPKTLNEINVHESSLTVVVIAMDDDTIGLFDTIRSLRSSTVKTISILTTSKDTSFLNDIKDYIMRMKKGWHIEIFNERVDDLSAIDSIAESIKTNWFYTIYAGDIITDEQAITIQAFLSDIHNNALCMYHNEEDNIRLVVNKFAFIEIFGNSEEPWFTKVRSFDNWREFCRKI
jgi:hypothetical protein